MSEEILLSISPARVMVDPGGSAQVVLQVQNRTAVVDEFAVDVLGDAANWTTLDRTQVPIFPDGTETVQVTIQPPRSSSPAAGSVPVGFRVRSTVNPALSSVEECKVEVKPFVEIAAEIAPKTARGRFSATHKLRVINKGNAPVNVSMRAEVQQGDCQVDVPAGPLLVDRGQRTTARIKVRPGSSRWQGSDEMHSYRLSLEPQGGAPVAIDGMMRQRPILGVPIAALAVIALLAVGALGVYGKGPAAPFRTALRWTGVVDVAPSPQAQATSQPTQASGQSGQTVVNPPTKAPTSAPSPTAAPTATPATSPTAAPTFNPIVVRPSILPIFLCTTLSNVALTDAASGTSHVLTWKSNGTCAGTYTGTISETIRVVNCPLLCIAPRTFTLPQVSGANGTAPAVTVNVGYLATFTITLSDGNGHTVTSLPVN